MTTIYIADKMNCLHVIKYYLPISVALLFTPYPKVFAQTNLPAIECQEVSDKQPTVSNKPVKLTMSQSELIDGSNSAQVGSLDESAQASNREQLLSGKPYVKQNIARSLQGIWQMRVNQADLQFLKAKYTITPTDSIVGSPFSKVEAKPLDIQQVKTCPDNTIIVQGGVVLVFSELFKFAQGNFNAQIEVCVAKKDTSCQ